MNIQDCKPCQAASKALNKATNIIEAYSNIITNNEEAEKAALERLPICMDCDNKTKLLTIGNKDFYTCKGCGLINCPIDAKIRSLRESCPLGKWNSINE